MSEDRGIALRVGVSGGDDGTMIEMTAIVPEHEAEFLLNRRLDMLVLAGKRQRARCQLPELRHERDATAQILHENREKLVALDAEFENRTMLRGAQRNEVRDKRGSVFDRFEREWAESGRLGPFEPKGQQKAELARYETAVAALNQEQEKANAEHQIARTQLENEIKKRADSVAILDRRIAESEALARGNDIFDPANDT